MSRLFHWQGMRRLIPVTLRALLVLASSTVMTERVSAQAPHPYQVGPGEISRVETGHHGLLKRFFHKLGSAFHAHVIGYPELFQELTLGASVRANDLQMVRNADPYRLTLYNTQFQPGQTSLTPFGEGRLKRLSRRLSVHPDPIFIEVVPGQTELAERRRTRVQEYLVSAGLPILPGQVQLVGPSAASVSGYAYLVEPKPVSDPGQSNTGFFVNTANATNIPATSSGTTNGAPAPSSTTTASPGGQ